MQQIKLCLYYGLVCKKQNACHILQLCETYIYSQEGMHNGDFLTEIP